jgi:hypothetical protein
VVKQALELGDVPMNAFKRFIKNEDPIVWKSLMIASAIALLFYIFVLVYAK